MNLISLLLFIVSPVAANPAPPAPITEKTWEHHPDIEAARTVVAEVDAARKAGQLTEKVKTCELESRTLAVDATGVVRYYRWEAGGEDSSDSLDYYYDHRGQLRFLHSTGGAVPDIKRETRAWFDEQGHRLWKRHHASGEGPDFDPVESADDYVITKPADHYASKPIHFDGEGACSESRSPPAKAGKAR